MSSRSRGVKAGQHAGSAGWSRTYGHNALWMRPAVLLLAKTLFVPVASAAPLSIWKRDIRAFEEDAPKSAADPDLYIYLGVAVALVLLGGVFAGLTIALMGQDETYLQVIATSGEGSERKHAEKVLRLLNRGKHWVLVTLLLSNVITNETLPIVLDRSLGGGWPAVLGSTVLIVIFGEIAPQSVCVRYGLSIGAFMSPLVLILMWIEAPVAWPTAKLLDWLLGEDHGTMYKKAGLKTLVQLHKTLGTTPGERLMDDEVTIINSVLDLKDKPVGDIMTPMQDVFTMSAETVLDERMMDTILSQGYSRIPIYAPDNNRNFIGMLLVKILITYDPEDAIRVRDFTLATLPETAPHTSCLDIINFFQEGKSHMVLVSDFPGQDKGALGVITLEDVIEELIGEEIIDESDVFVDVHKAIRRMAPAPQQKYKNRRLSQDPQQDQQADDENTPLISKRPSLGAPPSSFLIRRRSSTASNAAKQSATNGETVPVRTNTNEMREHLKHLGPSNAANKPRATKYTSVKIKPGLDTIPQGQQTAPEAEDQQKQRARPKSADDHPFSANIPPAPAIREGTTPPKSAGQDATGGAAALRAVAGYGSIGSSGGPNADQMSALEASRIAEEKAQEPDHSPEHSKDDHLEVPEKLVVGSAGAEEDDDQVGDMAGPTRERSKSRRAARSGSLTETHIDVGGMKKMVLDISSASDEEDGTSSSAADEFEDAKETNGGDATPARTDSGGSGDKKKRKKRGKRRK